MAEVDAPRGGARGGARRHPGINLPHEARAGAGGRGFDPTMRTIVLAAVDEARAAGASNVEAEHLLLAILSEPGSLAGVLAEAALDHDGLVLALRAEREHSLTAIGLGVVAERRLEATASEGRRPGWGGSVKEALARSRRAVTSRGRSDPRAALLAAVLHAHHGTVPRALTLAGIDIDALLGRLQRL